MMIEVIDKVVESQSGLDPILSDKSTHQPDEPKNLVDPIGEFHEYPPIAGRADEGA